MELRICFQMIIQIPEHKSFSVTVSHNLLELPLFRFEVLIVWLVFKLCGGALFTSAQITYIY